MWPERLATRFWRLVLRSSVDELSVRAVVNLLKNSSRLIHRFSFGCWSFRLLPVDSVDGVTVWFCFGAMSTFLA